MIRSRTIDPSLWIKAAGALFLAGAIACSVVANADALGSAKVSATVLGEAKGPKIEGFTYKNKTNNRKRWGHRQTYTRLEITGISR